MTKQVSNVKFILQGCDTLIHSKLKEIREASNMTQQELGDRVHVSRQTIISLERGSYNPSLELAFKIANVFSKTLDEIFIWEESV